MPDEERIDLVVAPADTTPNPREEPPRRRTPPWPPQQLAWTILAVLIAFGLGRVTSPGPTPTPPTLEPVANVAATGNRCSLQSGQILQLGIEIANQGAATAAVLSVQARMPLGVLELRDVGWGTCGQLRPTPPSGEEIDGAPVRPIPAGGSAWLYARFDVTQCPAPYPVQFILEIVGHPGVVEVGGFNDLGEVPYSGCS